MLAFRDNVFLAADALRAHKLRASLTMLGLTMGVATLIAVMTLVQGANRYVEQKIANLGTNVFRISRLPFAVTDFSVVVRAQRNKNILLEDLQAVAEGCAHCQYLGAPARRGSPPGPGAGGAAPLGATPPNGPKTTPPPRTRALFFRDRKPPH